MNESSRTPSVPAFFVPALLACMTMVALVGCAIPDFAVLDDSASTPETAHLVSNANNSGDAAVARPTSPMPAAPTIVNEPPTSLVSKRIATPVFMPQPARNPIVDLATGANLREELAGAEGGVLLDFYADWCGPCRQQGKLLHEVEDVATETGTKIIKINVDNHPGIARALSVTSLPTLLMVKQGKVVHRQTGVATARKLASWMQ